MIKNLMKTISSEFKAKVAIEAIKEQLTVEQVCRKYDVLPMQVNSWKNEFMQGAFIVFETESSPVFDIKEELVLQLYAQVGDLKVASDWLKNNL
jgi:transposase-like protein